MVRKEDLCDWFKDLAPHKRIDYMCGLLHLCLPVELRFIGTVLEDLAKKDFHYLRDQEIKANQPADLSNNNPSSLLNPQLRAKVLSALALMNSTNSSCADIIFDILKQHFDNLLGILHNQQIAEELKLILTMVNHHPAFNVYQKTQLGEILRRVEERTRELFGDPDEPDLVLPTNVLASEPEGPHCSVSSSQSPNPRQPEKVTVKSIEVVGAKEESHLKKGATEYQIHTTWSNGEITEVYMKYKQLRELHQKILHTFPDEKKKHTNVPYFPGQQSHNEESLNDQIASLNTYLSHVSKAPAYILDCEVLTKPLRSGTLVQAKPAQPVAVTPVVKSAPPPPQHYLSHASPSHEERGLHSIYELPAMYRQMVPSPYPGMVSYAQCSPGPSQLSSTANSPANSRTSSPALLMSSAGGKSNFSPTGRVVHPGVTAYGVLPAPVGNSPEGTVQLLRLLNLDQYYDNLKEFSVKQISSMSNDDFAKAGVPVDAQVKLKSHLDHLKQAAPDINGIVEPVSRLPAVEAYHTYPTFVYNQPMGFVSQAAHFPPHFFPHPYPQTSQVALHSSPHSHIPTGENSPANSEASSPSPSPQQQLPLQPVGGMLLDQGTNQAPPLQMMSPPAAVAAESLSPADVKGLKLKSQQMDSSGSEEDRSTGFNLDSGSVKGKGHIRPQQSQSLPAMNPVPNSVSAMDAMVMSAPPTHPAFISAEARTDNTPPPALPGVPVGIVPSQISTSPAAIVNGYMSDPPPVPPPVGPSIVQKTILNPRSFRSAQPTHTGLGIHKNVVNMPAYDMTLPPQVLGKNGNGGQVIHGNPHPYIAPPIVSTVPSTQVMGMSPANLQANNNTIQLGPQPPPPPSLMSEAVAGSYQPMFSLLSHPGGHRGILTSVANSTAVMTTTQSHPTGPPLSHSPSPVATTVGTDQVPAGAYLAEMVEPVRPEGLSVTPPSQTPPNISAFKSQTNASGHNSGTPSPPLVQATPKQAGNTEIIGGRQLIVVPHHSNGFMPHAQLLFIPQQGHQPQQQPFPNGIAPELYLQAPRYPFHMAPGQVAPYLYGNSVYPPQNLSATTHNTAHTSSSPTTATTTVSNQSHPSGVVSGKSFCYNCGQAGHRPTECKESTMESISNSFRLNYEPKPDPKTNSE